MEEYKGQGVFLNFWGTWCKPCEREFPIIDRYYNEYKEKGIQVLAINIAESDFVVQNYIDRKGLTFPVLIDKNKSVMEAYNINPLPTTILINSEGTMDNRKNNHWRNERTRYKELHGTNSTRLNNYSCYIYKMKGMKGGNCEN
ncbi:redoxin domain-containing protein [Lysinibacillus sp. IITD104]|uniref:redoxin domain-containing protein n=1 Tax=Lysinibacillus sp. FSL P2-0066 TaxID=2921720 RepID=UPI002FD4BDEC